MDNALYGRQTGGEVQIRNQHMHEVVSSCPECLAALCYPILWFRNVAYFESQHMTLEVLYRVSLGRVLYYK